MMIAEETQMIRDNIWSLLMLLPTDPRLRYELECLSFADDNATTDTDTDTDTHTTATATATAATDNQSDNRIKNWERFLPQSRHSPHRILYALQLVESLVASCPEDEDSRQNGTKSALDLTNDSSQTTRLDTAVSPA